MTDYNFFKLAIVLVSVNLFAVPPSLKHFETTECNESNLYENQSQVCLIKKNPSFLGDVLDESFDAVGMSFRSGIKLPNLEQRRGYSRIMYGPVYRSKNPFNDYDYWRYVTFYNSKTRTERLMDFPRVYEECQDGPEFSLYEQSLLVEAEIESGFSIMEIGISGRIMVNKTVTFTRSLTGIWGEEAIHTPYIAYESWSGQTLIQTYEIKTRRSTLRRVMRPDFSANSINPLIRVKRSNVQECED